MKKELTESILHFWRAIAKPSIALAAILALTFYLRLLYFGQIIDVDVGNLGYLAWRMAEGEVLIDFEGPGKPPLYFMLYSLFIRLFGPSVIGIKIFGAIFILLAVLAVYWVANRAYGKQLGVLAALLFGVFSSGPMAEGGTVNMETVLHLPYILAVGFFIKASVSGRLRWYFITGICAALATLVKQVGGVLFFVFLCQGIPEWWTKPSPFSKKQWFYSFLLLAGGALLPVFGVITFYQLHGYSLSQLYDSMLGSNLRYIQRGYEYTDYFKHFSSSMKAILPENGLLWLGTLAAAVFLIRRAKPGEEQVASRIFLWWAFWSFAVLGIVGTFYAHYFLQVVPPFSILTAYGLSATWRFAKSLRHPLKLVARWAWTIVLAALLVAFVRTDYECFFSYTPEEQTAMQFKSLDGLIDLYGLSLIYQQAIALHIRQHSDPKETIYVWGIAPQIYFLAQRKAATRYRTNFSASQLVTDKGLQALLACAPVLMEDLRKSRPVYIVQIFPLEFLQEFQTFVQSHYRPEAHITLNIPPYRVSLYRRFRD
ncbi:MAG: ArnT family glycosyltransferase [Thermodesulfobacteriota bacterium]